ncbi:MAG: response regulator [Magnetococcales bacterium]|nr:response regulator [Magnetococcales bacterium]
MISNQKILIVDDQKVNRDLLANLFQADYKVMVAGNGEQALIASSRPDLRPDLILLDVMMPGMDGYEVCRKLKNNEKTREIVVIFVTALGDIHDETMGLELGAVDYISKPFSPPIVRARVRNHLLLKSLRDTLEDQVATRTQALKSALLQTQASELAKKEFIARMSHELRTPLNAIISPISMLIKRTQDNADKSQLALIHESSINLLTLINEILDFSQLDSGEALAENYFNIKEFLVDLHSQWAIKASKKNLTMKLDCQKIFSLTNCFGDVTLLKRALEPLLDNAIKFTDSGEVVLRVVPTTIVHRRISLQFDIADTGIGIDPSQINEMFKPFTQAEPIGTRRFSGIGLGLPLAAHYVKQLGGDLQAKGALGKGSVLSFNISFSIMDAPDTTEHRTSISSPEELKSDLAKLSTLVKTGFRNTDQFLAEKVNQWLTTPWKKELEEIVNFVTNYNAKGSLNAIDALIKKLSC